MDAGCRAWCQCTTGRARRPAPIRRRTETRGNRPRCGCSKLAPHAAHPGGHGRVRLLRRAPGGHAPGPRSAGPAGPSSDDTRSTLDALVAVDTSHGHETDALKPIADRLRASLPFELVESTPGRGNLVARYKGTGAKRPLLLIAHVDVVPVEGQPWTVPPFQITEKDGFLYGRGVNDDKGMAAVIVALAAEMARTKPVLSRDVIFALTAGEETGGALGRAVARPEPQGPHRRRDRAQRGRLRAARRRRQSRRRGGPRRRREDVPELPPRRPRQGRALVDPADGLRPGADALAGPREDRRVSLPGPGDPGLTRGARGRRQAREASHLGRGGPRGDARSGERGRRARALEGPAASTRTCGRRA